MDIARRLALQIGSPLKIEFAGIWACLSVAAFAFVASGVVLGFRPILVFIKDNSEFVKIGLAGAAAIYSAALYHVSVEEKKVAATLEYSSKQGSGALRAAFKTLNTYWIRDEGFKTLIDYRAKKIDNEAWAKQASQYVRSSGGEIHIMAIHGFYRDIIACVDEDRCHRRTACQIFGSNVENFRLTYRVVLEEWERAWQPHVKRDLRNFSWDCKNRYKSNNGLSVASK